MLLIKLIPFDKILIIEDVMTVNIENLSDSEIKSMGDEVHAKRYKVNPADMPFGSVENLNDEDIRSIEAQVAEKRRQDIPFKEYFNNLVTNPTISDNQYFKNAVSRSIESNNIMRTFVSNLVAKISKETYEFKSIEKQI